MRWVRKENLERFMKENGLTKKQLCKNCEISVKTFNNFLKGKNCNLITFVKIASLTKFRFEDLYE